jgi:phage baseplate assembly protein V
MRKALDRMAAHWRNQITRGKVVSAHLSRNAHFIALQLSGLKKEVRQPIRLFHPYGFTAMPTGGEHVLLLQVGGSRSHLVALFADADGLRITDLQPGEFGWKDARAQQVVFRTDRIEVTALKAVVNVTHDAEVTVGGDMNVDVTGSANVSVGGDVNLDVVGKVVASAAEFDLTGDLKVDGDITATGDVSDHTRAMQGDRDIYNHHKHTGVSSGSTHTDATDSPE